MAVQAQYPSNVLLLNRSNGQEGHNYSLQTQTGGFLVDQSHMFFTNNGGVDSRKRGRESIILSQMNQFPLHNQIADISLLQNHHHHQEQPNVVVSTGLGLSFGFQLQQQNHHQFPQQHQQNNMIHNTSTEQYHHLLSEDFTTQIRQQREELDQFLRAQGEQLRSSLHNKRQRQYHALLVAAEESVTRKLKEKEIEVEKITRCNAELEARAAQLSYEAQAWQSKARAQEAAAASLQAQLHQALINGGGGGGCSGVAQDSRREEEGLGYAVETQAEDAESAYIDPERVVSSGPSCKGCRERAASVVVLPCRHLCLCTECDQVAQACPLCLTLKSSSVEVFLV